MNEPLQLFKTEAREIAYVMTDLKYIKIGHTGRSARRRGGELRAFPLFELAGGEQMEDRLHERFAKQRIGDSEWFKPEGELLLWVIRRVCQEGNPRACALLWETIRNHYGPVEGQRAA